MRKTKTNSPRQLLRSSLGVFAALTGAAIVLSACGKTEETPRSMQSGHSQQSEASRPVASGYQADGSYFERFDGNSLDPNSWVVYNGPATANRGVWESSQVEVKDGALVLKANGEKLGAACLCGPGTKDMIYGEYSFKLRMEGEAPYYLAGLMWPQELNGSRTAWPTEGEIDMIETHDQTRKSASYNIWYGYVADHGTQLLDNKRLMSSKYPQFKTTNPADFTQFQEVKLTWTPSRIALWHAGNLVFESTDPEMLGIISSPMHLVFQLDIPDNGKPLQKLVKGQTTSAYIKDVRVVPLPGVSKFARNGPTYTPGKPLS